MLPAGSPSFFAPSTASSSHHFAMASPPSRVPRKDPVTIRDAIGAIAPKGGTAIIDALRDVAERFGDGPGRRVVVLITDGYDERSQGESDDVLEELKASRVTVYVISIGGVAGVSIRGERLLRRIATDTGGRAFFPCNETAAHGRTHGNHGRRQAPVSAHVYAHESAARRHVAHYQGRDRMAPGIASLRARAIGRRTPRRSERPWSSPPRDQRMQHVDLTRRRPPNLRRRRPAEGRGVQRGGGARVDHARDGRQRQHDAIRGQRPGRRRTPSSRRCAPTTRSVCLIFADKVEVSHDLSIRRDLSHEAIEAYSTAGGTALYDALAESVTPHEIREGAPGRRPGDRRAR